MSDPVILVLIVKKPVENSSRLIALILACALLGSCTHRSAEYVYVYFTGDEYEVLELGEPAMAYERFSGEAIPIKYRVNKEGSSIEISVGGEAFVPDLHVKSTEEINEIDVVQCAYVIDRNDNVKVVIWPYRPPPERSCVSAGDKVTVAIWLSGHAQPIRLEGKIAKSGKFRYYDGL